MIKSSSHHIIKFTCHFLPLKVTPLFNCIQFFTGILILDKTIFLNYTLHPLKDTHCLNFINSTQSWIFTNILVLNKTINQKMTSFLYKSHTHASVATGKCFTTILVLCETNLLKYTLIRTKSIINIKYVSIRNINI